MTPTIHPSFLALVSESPATKVACSKDGVLLTYAQVVQELQMSTPLAHEYAHALVALFLDMLPPQEGPADASHVPSVPQTAIDVTPRVHAIAHYNALPEDTIVWKTMSHQYKAHEMAVLLEQGDHYARQILSDCLRVTRDVLGRKAEYKAELDAELTDINSRPNP